MAVRLPQGGRAASSAHVIMDDILLQVFYRDVLALLAVAADYAWSTTRRVACSLAPVVRPPRALRVRSDDGREYSGVLLVEANEIVFGIIVCTGHAGGLPPEARSQPNPTPPTRPPFISPARFDEPGRFEDRGRLPGWADDPRDEDDLWKRR